VPEPEAFFKLLNAQVLSRGRRAGGRLRLLLVRVRLPRDEDGNPKSEEMRAEMDEVEALLAGFFPREDLRCLFKDMVAMAAGACTLEQLQVFFIFFGLLGSNGKSALLRWLEMVFGPQYNKALDPS